MPGRALFLLLFAIMTLMGVLMSYTTVSDAPPGQLSDFSRRFIYVRGITYWALWGAMAPAVFYLSRRFRFGARRLAAALGAHAVGSLVFALVHSYIAIAVALAIRALMRGEPLWPLDIFRHPFGRLIIEWEITIYWALAGLAHAIMSARDARDRAVTSAKLEAQLARAQVQVLQRQLQPHFLFNTLQSLSALIHRDQRAADEMLGQLSQLLRLTLRGTNEPEVSLERELLHTRRYLEIERTNLGSRLRLVEDIEPGLLGAAVPSLLLQPLAENAVRHGIAPLPSGGTIRIEACRRGDQLELVVADDGVGLGEGEGRDGSKSGLGIGLENSRQRLRYLYGDRQSFSFAPNGRRGVAVTIRFPFREMPVEARREADSWVD